MKDHGDHRMTLTLEKDVWRCECTKYQYKYLALYGGSRVSIVDHIMYSTKRVV